MNILETNVKIKVPAKKQKNKVETNGNPRTGNDNNQN